MKSRMSSLRIGVDLGGTQVRAGLVKYQKVINLESKNIRSLGTKEEVFDDLCSVIDKVMDKKVMGIGIGVPSLLDPKTGVIYDTTNIPAWKKVPLRKLLEKKYRVPVYLDNDANCFTLGELHDRKSVGNSQNFVGLIIGTGLGAGIISNGKLHSGQSCGAGEFGMFPYLDATVEAYASGQFFKKFDKIGSQLFLEAKQNKPEALEIFHQYGRHLGEAIKLILFAVAPEVIVLGGSVSLSHKFFESSLLESLQTFPSAEIRKNLKIKVSHARHGAILGAASLLDN